ncbi:MAG TPA: hypothetical protein VFH48_27780, partial [Chloroflexota bacterium]|nr:hypothetical protein [Chloroflexota bacterium]
MDARIRSTSPMSSRSPLGVSRRRFLAVGLGLSALSLLAACAPAAPSSPAKPAETKPAEPAKPAESKPAAPATTAPAAAKPAESKPAAPAAAPSAELVKAPESNPKRGGTIKIAGFGDPAHFDLDQSPTIVNLWPQSPMYDNLVRFNPI